MKTQLRSADVLRRLPAEWPADPKPELCRLRAQLAQKVVVLDDDPTGTQTVHGIPVLTEWSVDSLRVELSNSLPGFYILTNSRSLPLPGACRVNREIAENLSQAADVTARKFVVVSRSDSTLRGHFPGEVEALGGAFHDRPWAVLLIPFFLEGGRLTIGNVHYVKDADWFVPAGQTEFARDPVFGYHASDLREWVEEKTGGRIPAASVKWISIADIRLGGPNQVTDCLRALYPGSVCVVNCASMRDLEVFTLGLLEAELTGAAFLYRTAASFAAVRMGVDARPLLSPEEVCLGDNRGGLIVAGSYVPRTTAQLRVLLDDVAVVGMELDVDAMLDSTQREPAVRQVAQRADCLIADGRDVAVFTSRKTVAVENSDESLSIGRTISSALVDVIRLMETRPRYILAKGGITSSDVATRALHVKRAMVRGQVLPGVPVWELGPESRYPGLPYVVFPGNVGSAESLAQIVRTWRV